MPRKRTETPSVPTMLRWQKTYLVQMSDMVKRGAISKAHGKRVAKGLAFSIKALEDSALEHRSTKRESERDAYDQAREELLG